MSTRYYEPPEPINKPEKTMRLRFVGESFWNGDGLTNGQVYEAWVDPDSGMYRVIDDSGEDYLYSPDAPGPTDRSAPNGRWEIVEGGD
ncbi:MAG: hypothetical protein ACOX8F_07280 [Sakamotonia sp.]|jgi:hypothetical protein